MKHLGALVSILLVGCSGTSPLAPSDGGSPDLFTNGPTEFPQAREDAFMRKPYPIVLAHGMSGFKNIGPLNYYYGVADALKKDGHDVYVSQVDAFNSSE